MTAPEESYNFVPSYCDYAAMTALRRRHLPEMRTAGRPPSAWRSPYFRVAAQRLVPSSVAALLDLLSTEIVLCR
jgi:hypothetical protein